MFYQFTLLNMTNFNVFLPYISDVTNQEKKRKKTLTIEFHCRAYFTSFYYNVSIFHQHLKLFIYSLLMDIYSNLTRGENDKVTCLLFIK